MAWRAVPIAGLAGGLAYLLVTVILTPALVGGSSGLTLRYSAALLLGPGALVEAGITPLAVGLLVHLALSVLFALIIAVVVHRWGLWVGILGGAALGLALYGINLYFMTRVFDWFRAINTPVLLLAHLVFGAVAGGVYEALDTYDEGSSTVEATHV
jgi:hypothetical protein